MKRISSFLRAGEGDGHEDQVVMTDIFAGLVLVLFMMVGGDPSLVDVAPPPESAQATGEMPESLRLYLHSDGRLIRDTPSGVDVDLDHFVKGLSPQALADQSVELIYPGDFSAGLVHEALRRLHRVGLTNTTLGLSEYAVSQSVRRGHD